MRDEFVRIESIQKVNSDVFLLSFGFSSAFKALPGQFLHINLCDERIVLRRPFSIHGVFGKKVQILFRAKGRGTSVLSQKKKGDSLKVLGPLGNGFSVGREKESSIFIAGGMGVAPLLFLAQKLSKQDMKERIVLLGAKKKSELLCVRDFQKLGYAVGVATDDGSLGFRGSVVDLLFRDCTGLLQEGAFLYGCGPLAMLKNLAERIKLYPQVRCEVSFEEFMGCGLGVCKACAVETKRGIFYACKDGPVFQSSDLA